MIKLAVKGFSLLCPYGCTNKSQWIFAFKVKTIDSFGMSMH